MVNGSSTPTAQDHPAQPSTATAAGDQVVTPPLLERRLTAVGIDMALVGACCIGLLHSFNPLAEARWPMLWIPSAVTLGAYLLVQFLSGDTPGKRILGLSLRKNDITRTPASFTRLLVRGFVRELPVLLLLPALLVRDIQLFLLIGMTVLSVVVCYFPICYILMARTGRTMFDAVGATVLVRTR